MIYQRAGRGYRPRHNSDRADHCYNPAVFTVFTHRIVYTGVYTVCARVHTHAHRAHTENTVSCTRAHTNCARGVTKKPIFRCNFDRLEMSKTPLRKTPPTHARGSRGVRGVPPPGGGYFRGVPKIPPPHTPHGLVLSKQGVCRAYGSTSLGTYDDKKYSSKLTGE